MTFILSVTTDAYEAVDRGGRAREQKERKKKHILGQKIRIQCTDNLFSI